ncbi:MAG: hypothetical protein SVM80_12305 [Halobacteriota archaeon]|nr:hypothetical protein [Halobacteriota archaeon]
MEKILRSIFIVALFSLIIIAGDYQLKNQVDSWLKPVVSEGELLSTNWIATNTSEDDKFAAGIFGGELIMGMTTRVPLVGGDWANAPDPTQNMADANEIFLTNSSKRAFDLCKKQNCTYVFVPMDRKIHTGYGWIDISSEKFSDQKYFDLVYENQDVQIYAVVL